MTHNDSNFPLMAQLAVMAPNNLKLSGNLGQYVIILVKRSHSRPLWSLEAIRRLSESFEAIFWDSEVIKEPLWAIGIH